MGGVTMPKALVVPANEAEPTYYVDLDTDNPYDSQVQHLVGGWVELVRTSHTNISYLVDEEGLLKERTVNPRASKFYPGPTPICGVAVFVRFERTPEDIFLQELTARDLEWINSIIERD